MTLLSGMNADVEVVAGEAHNAVLVPVQALRQIGEAQAGDSQYAVFVVQANGELDMRLVEVSLKDYVNAAIVSGLEPGEAISLGTATTGSGTTTVTGTESQEEGRMPMGGGMPFLDGGGPPAGP